MDEMMKINGQIGDLLEPITEFKPSIWKITEVGYMMRCFYELHENEEFEKALNLMKLTYTQQEIAMLFNHTNQH